MTEPAAEQGRKRRGILTVMRAGPEMLAALRRRREQLAMSFEELDDIAGLTPGYSAKLLADPPIRGFGPMSMWCLAGALGVAFALVEDKQRRVRATPNRKIKQSDSVRHWRYTEAIAKALRTVQETAKINGSIGGTKRWQGMTREELADQMSRLAKVRWRAHRRLIKLQAIRAADTSPAASPRPHLPSARPTRSDAMSAGLSPAAGQRRRALVPAASKPR